MCRVADRQRHRHPGRDARPARADARRGRDGLQQRGRGFQESSPARADVER